MKKTLALLLTALLVFSLCACGSANSAASAPSAAYDMATTETAYPEPAEAAEYGGFAAAEDYIAATDDHSPMVILATASPYKFPAAVLSAIGGNTEGSEYEQMDRLHEITGVPIPAPLASLRGKRELHTGVIEKEQMLDYVMKL